MTASDLNKEKNGDAMKKILIYGDVDLKLCIFHSAKRRTNIDKFRQDLYGMVREIHAGRYPFNNFLY